MKIFIDSEGKVRGAQAVGRGAASRINIVSAFIKKDANILELVFAEQAYCPEVCELYDVINVAAENALRKIKNRKSEFKI